MNTNLRHRLEAAAGDAREKRITAEVRKALHRANISILSKAIEDGNPHMAVWIIDNCELPSEAAPLIAKLEANMAAAIGKSIQKGLVAKGTTVRDFLRRSPTPDNVLTRK